MERSLFLFTVFALFGCQHSGPISTERSQTTESRLYQDTSSFEFNGFKSSAWVSDKFTGTHSRQIKDDVLTFTTTQSAAEGGLDVGLSVPDLQPMTVDRIPDGASICSAYDISLSGTGRWWAGPKISVNWQGDESAKQNGDDWYETYIVEIASSSPETLHGIFTGDYFKADILPDITLNGATYRNYRIRFHDWWQFWSIRQTYREVGTVPLKPILNLWSEHGLPTDRRFDGVKANVETYGNVSGSGRLAVQAAADPTKILDCAF